MIVCADDFGLAPGIDHAIMSLARTHLLSAVSAMVCYPDTHRDFDELKQLIATHDIGLHLRFTVPQSSEELTPKALLNGEVLNSSFSRHISEEILHQLLIFRKLMGRVPTFIDAHRHLHVFPVIGHTLASVLERYPEFRPEYIRGFGEIRHFTLTTLAQYLLWKSSARALDNLNISLSPGVLLLPVSREYNLASVLTQLLRESRHRNDVLVVHPGQIDDVLRTRDPVHSHRELCLAALQSKAYRQALNEHGGLNRYVT